MKGPDGWPGVPTRGDVTGRASEHLGLGAAGLWVGSSGSGCWREEGREWAGGS